MSDQMNNRHYGIDLLKILSMYMVVILHVLGKGAILDNTVELSANYMVAWFLEIAAYCAVNCYALISGYVGYTAKHKVTNIVMLWLQVAFSLALISLLFLLFVPGTAEVKDIIKAFFPVTFEYYWYFTAYFGMWLFIPFMNAAIENTSQYRTGLALAFAAVFFVWCSVMTDSFHTLGGYGIIWISYLYMVGAWFRKYNIPAVLSKKKWLLLYIASIVLTFLSKIALVAIRGSSGNILVNYISPTILLAAVALLGIFAQVNIAGRMSAIVVKFSALSFGVYIIHCHPKIVEYLLKERFAFVADMPAVLVAVVVLLLAALIYLVCSGLDYLRVLLFQLLHIKSIVNWFIEKIGVLIKHIIMWAEKKVFSFK